MNDELRALIRSEAEHAELRERAYAVAVTLCNASTVHSAGTGRHDATRWGPCSQHEADTSAVMTLLADAWGEGHEEGCANPHGCPAHENPYRAEVAP